MTMGGVPAMVQCKNTPTWISTENQPGRDGLIGAMALCDECKAAMERQLGKAYATCVEIKTQTTKP